MAGSTAALYGLRSYYEAKIRENCAEIKKLEREYESLAGFKGIVSGSEGEFHSFNEGEKGALAPLQDVMTNCRSARVYYEGMNRTFRNAGDRLIGRVYSSLLNSISRRLKKYLGDINKLSDENERYSESIADLNTQIKESEAKDAAEGESD